MQSMGPDVHVTRARERGDAGRSVTYSRPRPEIGFEISEFTTQRLISFSDMPVSII